MTTTSISGADVDQLTAMAGACADGAEHLAAVAQRTTVALCTQLPWHGPDATAMRAQWQNEALPAISAVAARLHEAGLHLVREAQEQLAVSTDSAAGGSGAPTAAPVPAVPPGAPSAPAAPTSPDAASTPAGASSRSLAETLAGLRDKLLTMTSVAGLGEIMAELPTLGDDWANLSGAVARVDAAQSLGASLGATALDLYSTVMDAHGLVTGLENRDVAGVIEHGIPLAFTAMGPEIDATLGTAWAAGTMIGTEIYEGMQGTRYGDIVRDMTDIAFEENGAGGLLQVPGILGLAAIEYFTGDAPPEK